MLTCLITTLVARPAGRQAALTLHPAHHRKQLSRSYDLGENAALARAVESSPDALMVCDSSQTGWRVLLVNENWVKATGQAANACPLSTLRPLLRGAQTCLSAENSVPLVRLGAAL